MVPMAGMANKSFDLTDIPRYPSLVLTRDYVIYIYIYIHKHIRTCIFNAFWTSKIPLRNLNVSEKFSLAFAEMLDTQ